MEATYYKLPDGILAIIDDEGRLFVEAEQVDEETVYQGTREEDEEEKPKKKKTGKTAGRKINPITKEKIIEELKRGEKTLTELANEFDLSYNGLLYIKKKAGLIEPKSKKEKVNIDGEVVEKNNKTQKMFSCSCGRGFSAWVKNEPGETVECPDKCGNIILASEGEDV